jgi:hypothetical protein
LAIGRFEVCKIADDENIWIAGHGAIGLDDHSAGAVKLRTGRFGNCSAQR